MTTNTLRKIGSLKGKKLFLLNEFKLKSIKDAKRDYEFTGTDDAMYNELKDKYNTIIEQLQQEKRQLLIQKQKEIQKANRSLKKQLLHYDLPENTIVRRILPTKEEVRQFKNAAVEAKFVSNDRGTLEMINNSIPTIIKALKDMKGIKVQFTFGILFSKLKAENNKEFIEYPFTTKTKIITNISEVQVYIQKTVQYLKDKIPEIEAEGSNLIFEFIKYITVHIHKYNPLKIKSYLPLPPHIRNKKCCINIKNENDECLKYCVLYHLHKDKIIKDADRVSKY